MGRIHRVLVLADGDNTFIAAQKLNRRMDWRRIREYLADEKEGRELIEMVIYVGLPPDRDRYQDERKKKESFINSVKSQGFLVVTKEGKPKGDEYEADADVLMAMDAIELAVEMRPDIVVLVTGDSDFAYLAQKLRRRGIRVEVASVAQQLGNELKNSANSVVDLLPVFDDLDQFRQDQEYHRIGRSDNFFE